MFLVIRNSLFEILIDAANGACLGLQADSCAVTPRSSVDIGSRPRSSLLARFTSSCLTGLANSSFATSSRETSSEWDDALNLFRDQQTEWAGSLERISSGLGGAFFLTSLFIELINYESKRLHGPLFFPHAKPACKCGCVATE